MSQTNGETPDYRVVVQSPIFREPLVVGFHEEEDARAFYERVSEEGVELDSGLRVLPAAIETISLEGVHGVTVRPAPAVLMPQAES